MPPKKSDKYNAEDPDDENESGMAGILKNTKFFFQHQKQKTLELNDKYWRFVSNRKNPQALKDTSTVWDVYLKWQEYQLEKHDKEDFTGIDIHLLEKITGRQPNIGYYQQPVIASEPDLFKQYTALSKSEVQIDRDAGMPIVYHPWQMRISMKINAKIKNLTTDKQQSILESIFQLQLGMMADSQILETGPIMYLAGFSKMIKNNQTIVYAVVPERVPVIQTVLDKTHIVGFHYRQYLRIIDIVFTSDKKQIYQAFQNFLQYLQDDPDKWNPFLPGNFMENNAQMMMGVGSSKHELLDIQNIVKHNSDSLLQTLTYLPLLNTYEKLSSNEIRTFELVAMRWVSSLEESKFSFKVRPDVSLKNVNKMIIEKCTSEESCTWLLDFLHRIPNFNLNLTMQEKKLITTPGNVLCIGRSGTGKTTSAVLRLFALEILFKIRSTLFFKGSASLKQGGFTSEEAESTTGLHSVIVTASPVLTNEIRRFYTQLKAQVIGELKKREEKRQKKKAGVQQEEEVKEEQQESDIDNLQEAIKTQKVAEEEEKEEDVESMKEDELLDMEEMEKNMNMAQSLNEMRNEDFPAFLTIKRLVFMIDGSLGRPFFARNMRNEIIGLDSQAEWHNEQKGVLMINNYYKSGGPQDAKEEDDIDKFMNLSSSDDESEGSQESSEDDVFADQVQGSKKRKTKYIQGERVVQEYAQEVDFETFERKFWPKFCARETSRNMTPAQVWTDIFSVIKGSHNSYEYVGKGLPKDKYVSAVYRKTLLDHTEKEIIYNVYQKYEAWKRSIKGFDFMDLVNHILRELQGSYYRGTPIHFMLVDEVQDLTPATIKLLLKITEQNVYFAGDTAQTIARGVGFRFCDLKGMLNMTDFEAPKVLQLTVNFRSHNRILTLANSIITAIELFFPLTIDKLHKEKSNLDGLKPIILDSNLLDSLFYVLMGKNNNSSASKSIDKSDFGCDQVIIVRDQESKKRVPSVLQHALCLTVYECKGLEFEDVILYNFFNDAPQNIHEQWKLINYLQIDKVKTAVAKSGENDMQDLDDLNFEIEKEQENAASTTNAEKEPTEDEIYEFADRIYLQKSNLRQANSFQKEYSALCTELKQLYVCITRPKKRLIIYDEDPSTRETILKYWQRLSAVDIVTESMINHQETSPISDEQKQLLEKLREGKNAEQQEEKSAERAKGWRAQGIKMFKRRYYEQAMKCFDHSGDVNLRKRALAYSLAEDASKTQSESDTLQYKFEETYKELDKSQKKLMREEISQLHQKSLSLFYQASQVFLDIDLKKQAAQCLFTSEQYVEAAKIFEEIGFYSQAGESHFILGDYSRAAMLYSEGKNVSKAVECYKKMKNWDAILQCVKTHEEDFTQEQRQELIKKYVPLALNSLYSLITQDEMVSEDEENEAEEPVIPVIAQKIRDFEVKTPLVMSVTSQIQPSQEVIEEEIDETIEENSDESDVITNQSQIQLPPQNVEIVEEESKTVEGGFEAINKPKPKKVLDSGTDSSFSVISSQQLDDLGNDPHAINQNQMDSFEHLSQFDPEDEFIKSRTVSVLESVVSGSYKNKDNKSELSDYSIIASNQDNLSEYTNAYMRELIQQQVNTIVTKRDIYAEDILMTKIIHYVSQFSGDVKSYLLRLRSKDALLSNLEKPKVNKESMFEQIDTSSGLKNEDQLDLFDIDLEQIDNEFLNTLLDCLESFELYKLCLIVCNRYQLTERVGRYIVSIANKYSNLQLICTTFLSLFHPQHKEVQSQISFIAHQALHSALELIDPKYLRIQEGGMLGQYCFTGLLNNGYWKKLLYLMDLKSGLCVASMFGDFKNFRQLYMGFAESAKKYGLGSKEQYIRALERSDFTFIGKMIEKTEYPQNEIERIAYTNGLDSIMWSNKDEPNYFKEIKFPKCFELSEQASKLTSKFGGLSIQEKADVQEKLLKALDQKVILLTNNHRLSPQGSSQYLEECYIYDVSVAIFLLLSSGFKGTLSSQVHVLTNLPSNLFQVYLRTLNRFMTLLMTSQSAKVTKHLMHGMLSVLKVRPQLSCDAIYDTYGDRVYVSHQSFLAQLLTKQSEDFKKTLADRVTKQVFSEMDTRWHTKGEINKVIKNRLREMYQQEAIHQMVEIIDLEANFMRAPLSIVMEVIKKQVSQYVKFCTEKSLAARADLAILKSWKNVDDLESPFDISEKYMSVLNLLNSNYEIQRFVSQRNPNPKQISEQLGKHKIHNQSSIEYHILVEEKKKLEQQIKYKQYMVDIGLIPKSELEKFVQAKEKKNQAKDVVKFSQTLYTKNAALFAFLNFNAIPGPQDQQLISNLLDAGYYYWEFFIQTKNMKQADDFGEFKFALISLSFYAAADQYVYFMQMVTKQLPPKSLERKLLLILLDSYFYKKAGHSLEASCNIIKFVQLGLGQIQLHSFYFMTLIEQALLLLLSSRPSTEKKLFLPFEYVKYLNLWDVSQEQKDTFANNLEMYFSESEEYDFSATPISLELKNTSQYVITSNADKQTYKENIISILKCLAQIAAKLNNISLVHLFLSVLTISVNEPQMSAECYKQVETILEALVSEELIDEEQLYQEKLMGKKVLGSQFVEAFRKLDYYAQNDILNLEKRQSQQSIWIEIDIKHPEVIPNAQVQEKIKQAEVAESTKIAQLTKVASLFNKFYLKNRDKLKKRIAKKKQGLKLDDYLMIAQVAKNRDDVARAAEKNIEVLRAAANLSKYIRIVTLNSRFETVIDLHYLLNQLHNLETQIIPQALSQDVDSSEILRNLNQIHQQVVIWSQSKEQEGNGGNMARNQRIMKLKWREQALKVRQRLMAKVAIKKKEDAYSRKKMRLKMAGK